MELYRYFPVCLHGTDRNIIYIIFISNILCYVFFGSYFVMIIYSASSDPVRTNT